MDQRISGCLQEILNASLINGCLSACVCFKLDKGCGLKVEKPEKAVEGVSL